MIYFLFCGIGLINFSFRGKKENMNYLECRSFCASLKASSDPSSASSVLPAAFPRGWLWRGCSDPGDLCPVEQQLVFCNIASSPPARRALDGAENTVSFAVNAFCESTAHPTQMGVRSLMLSKPKASMHPQVLLHPGPAAPLPSGPAAWCIPELGASDGEEPGLEP